MATSRCCRRSVEVEMNEVDSSVQCLIVDIASALVTADELLGPGVVP